MKNQIDTIYILENPEKNIIKFATGYQLKYDDIIKDVFGVACLNDLEMMIQFNKPFQDSICTNKEINVNKISLTTILRIASKTELLQLRNELLEEVGNLPIPRPFDSVIKLQEGIFHWDETNSTYISEKLGA
ncbi:hypothetical protein [Bacillus sp. OK048]|uniref:hypothetical protein n=1 Tax=Bacillus sp. OK048 TaxID=1882761 RepID=UPI00088B7169|nr:hypothetical protein [Bacillus sp. OK048]SDN33883.1 hypothetical protein SAMN05443253_110143 [Bacillus sp. OK048]